MKRAKMGVDGRFEHAIQFVLYLLCWNTLCIHESSCDASIYVFEYIIQTYVLTVFLDFGKTPFTDEKVRVA